MKTLLIEFEKIISEKFEQGEIKGPIHLSGGNELDLIDVFKHVKHNDYVFSNWRNHYHALLHGVPPNALIDEIMRGHSMNIMFPQYNFFTSSIVSGILPIAVGVAAGLKRNGSSKHVWAFIGDMTACTGIFHECQQYAQAQKLPITFVVEENGFSTDTPTLEAWGKNINYRCGGNIIRYKYERTYPHCGIGRHVNF